MRLRELNSGQRLVVVVGLEPAGDVPFSAAAWPVTSVMYAMVIGAGDAAAFVAAAPKETSGKLAMAANSEMRMARRRHTFYSPVLW
jgi:hypothetical protein